MKSGGPPPLRTPDFLNGLPGLSERDLKGVTDSRELLTRCCQLLTAAFDSGGHVSLEQPPSAMSWEEPVVSAFLLYVSALLVYIPACAFGVSIRKAWLFATTFPPLIQFATVCSHDRGAHLDVYPEALAQSFSEGCAEGCRHGERTRAVFPPAPPSLNFQATPYKEKNMHAGLSVVLLHLLLHVPFGLKQ